MPRKIKCFIDGCSSKRESNSESKISFFRAPLHSLSLWQDAIPGKNVLKKDDPVCQFHFKEDELSTHFENIVMKDGSLMKKDKAKLKSGSIPSIFPNIVEENTNKSKKVDCVYTSDNSAEAKKRYLSGLNNASTADQEVWKMECDSTSLKSMNRDNTVITSNGDNVTTLGMENVNSNSIRQKSNAIMDKIPVVIVESIVDNTNVVDVEVSTNKVDQNLDNSMVIAPEIPSEKVYSLVSQSQVTVSKASTNNTTFLNICKELHDNPRCISMPGDWIPHIITNQLPCIMWSQYSVGYDSCEKRIVLFPDMTVKIFIEEIRVNVDYKQKLQSCKDIQDLIRYISDSVLPCQGIENSDRSKNCSGYVIRKVSSPGPQIMRCNECSVTRRSLQKKSNKKQIQVNEKKKRTKFVKRCKNLTRQSDRQKSKIARLKMKVYQLKTTCARTSQEALEKACEKLPENQRLNIQACVDTSKVKDIRGMRYTTQWIYECLMLRIKSKKTYVHLQTHKILALPCLTTLNKYMKQIKGAYGYHQSTFDILKTKTQSMDSSDVRGVILVDEMKLAKSLSFNRKNLQFEGFTDLGKYTPKHQVGVKGDHALVIMFQPFKGKWVQTLGCFLSKGSATGTVLHQILMEGILLAEKAGLKVDAVTSDGASWNRNMWEQFGVDEKNISIEHIADPDRRLWFLSDFPHLIKCLRNFFTKQDRFDKIWTPDGLVTLNHWHALLSLEDPKSYNLKVNYKIRQEHLSPAYYQKMNVAMAFQFFGAADPMRVLRNNHPDLIDCEPSIKLCQRVKSLIRAMNSRTPMDNLKPGNEMWKAIEDFIDYLDKWEQTAKKNGKMEFMPEGTCYGLKISLKATLQVCEFLVNKCGFKYLMTARLNQDCLERFFGMMRHYCGSNDHPDSALFIQTYKLVSTYSLVKPPKGSNVTSTNLMEALIKINEYKDENVRREKWDEQIDALLEKGLNTEILSEAVLLMEDHDYFQSSTSDYVLAYVGGFVARKCSRFARVEEFASDGKKIIVVCEKCTETVSLGSEEVVPESYKLIEIKNRGALFKPSVKLFNLVSTLERAILKIINEQKSISPELLFDVTAALEKLPALPLLGCEKHDTDFTHKIIAFFLTTRMFMVAKQSNKNDNIERETTREKRKLSKLPSAPAEKAAVKIVKHPNAVKTKSRKRKAPKSNKGTVVTVEHSETVEKARKKRKAPKSSKVSMEMVEHPKAVNLASRKRKAPNYNDTADEEKKKVKKQQLQDSLSNDK